MLPDPPFKDNLYYLAGGFYSNWRERLIVGTKRRRLVPITPLDSRRHAAFAFVSDDLAAIDKCKAVIAHICPPPIRNSGTAAELGYAAARQKPILLIVEISVSFSILVLLENMDQRAWDVVDFHIFFSVLTLEQDPDGVPSRLFFSVLTLVSFSNFKKFHFILLSLLKSQRALRRTLRVRF